MTGSTPQIPEYVAVECPVCYTRMHARPRRKPGQIKCPDCYTLARVPSIAEVLARLPRQRPPEDIGSYDLGSETNPTVDDPSLQEWPTVGSYHLQLPATGPHGASSAAAPEPSPATAAMWFAPAPPSPAAAAPSTRRDAPPADSPPADAPPADAPPADAPPRRRRPPAEADESREPPAAEVPSESFTVSCPACGARIAPPSSEEPMTILCPECLEDVPVPARAELRARHRPPQPPRERDRTQAPREQPRPARPETAARGERTRPRSRPSASGSSASARPRAEERRAAPAAPPAAAEPNGFAAAPLPEPPRPYVNVFDAMAEIRQEQPDPPPRWTFFSRVFEFPWRPDMLVRWVYLLLGFTAFGITLAGWAVLAQITGVWILVMVLFLPGLVATSGLTLSYAAACFMPILIDTAAGNDRVTSWLDSNWREWAVELMYLICMGFTAALFGHLTGLGAELAGFDYGTTLAATIVLAFPIVLLSSQEANSPFIPLSLPILKSLVTCAWAWLMFYALSGFVLGAAAVLIALQWLVSPYLALMGSGPVLATVCLLYPRLLGRLAWRASLARPRRRKRRREAALPAPAGGIK